jgi:hypothetical protein
MEIRVCFGFGFAEASCPKIAVGILATVLTVL